MGNLLKKYITELVTEVIICRHILKLSFDFETFRSYIIWFSKLRVKEDKEKFF